MKRERGFEMIKTPGAHSKQSSYIWKAKC